MFGLPRSMADRFTSSTGRQENESSLQPRPLLDSPDDQAIQALAASYYAGSERIVAAERITEARRLRMRLTADVR